jgi:ABC-2 type transport system ATP-binding protein
MCERVLVLEKGVLAFDGPADEGIRFLRYDDDDGDDVNSESDEEGTDDDMDSDFGAEI